jgi:hypothetical protein
VIIFDGVFQRFRASDRNVTLFDYEEQYAA